MRVVIVSLFYHKELQTEEELLERHYTTTGWAEALARKGVEVIVINRFHRNSSITKNNVSHLFYKDSFGTSLKSWQIPWKFMKQVRELKPDIVHLHSLTLSLQTLLLRLLLYRKTAIVVQHHGGKSPGKFKRWLHNQLNYVADSFFFTSPEQGMDWFMKKKPFNKIMPVMEGATFFDFPTRDQLRPQIYHNRNIAKQNTKLYGSPVFLWVGRLDSNKDPLTILDSFKIIFKKYSTAKLYMVYSDDKLENEVRRKIDSVPILKDNTMLIGKIPHTEIENYYNSADYFVLGSHYEGSGYALSEALRCGCIPIVTNIPSFRMMTNDGQLGALWQPGNKDSFIEAVDKTISKNLQAEAEACINFYQEKLSFDAIAATAIHHYRNAIAIKHQIKTEIPAASNA